MRIEDLKVPYKSGRERREGEEGGREGEREREREGEGGGREGKREREREGERGRERGEGRKTSRLKDLRT